MIIVSLFLMQIKLYNGKWIKLQHAGICTKLKIADLSSSEGDDITCHPRTPPIIPSIPILRKKTDTSSPEDAMDATVLHHYDLNELCVSIVASIDNLILYIIYPD